MQFAVRYLKHDHGQWYRWSGWWTYGNSGMTYTEAYRLAFRDCSTFERDEAVIAATHHGVMRRR